MLALLLGLLVVSFEMAVRAVPPLPVPRPPKAAMWIEDSGGVPLAAFVSDADDWHLPLAYEEISPHLLSAIVAVEDRRFFEHGGIDVSAAGMACVQNVSSGRIIRGASTLTMQLVRLRDPKQRSYAGKLSQAFRARQIELSMGKQAILAEYVNRAPFGGNLMGAGAASWRYFGKRCRDLSLGEAALLAGLPQSPNRFRPDRSAAFALRRRDYVLDRMVAAGMISPRQADEAKREPLEVRWRPLPQQVDSALAAAVPTLANLVAQTPTGITRTTLSAPLQRQVAAITREQLATLASSHITSAGVIVIDTETAECRAIVNLSADSPDVDLVRSPRSTGSVLKPFIYAAAFETGKFDRLSVLDDSPAAWAGYTPLNFDKSFRGPMPAGEALAESRNIPAMTLLAHVGVERAAGLIESMGVKSLRKPGRPLGVALAIGGGDATCVEIAEAYATLARGGRHVPVRATPRAERAGVEVLPASTCREVLACLSDKARTARVSPETARLLPAWKTGTSSGNRDAWCAAVTQRYTVVVWLGNSSGKGSNALVGTDVAAPLALGILGAIDGTTRALPAPDTHPTHTDQPATHTLNTPNALTMTSPAPNSDHILQSDAPAARQRIALTSAGGTGAQRYWFVDGAMVGSGAAAETVWWTPASGTHEVRVVDGAGHAATARVTVHVDGGL